MGTERGMARLRLSVLLPYIRTRKGLVALTLLLVVASVLLELASPILVGLFIDGATGTAALSELTLLGIFFLAAGIGTQVFSAAYTYAGTKLGWDVANDLRLEAADHLVSLDLDYHTTTSPGTLIERIDGDITAVAKVFSHFAVRVVAAALLLVGIFVVSFIKSVVAGSVVVAFALVVVFFLSKTRAIGVAASKEERGISAELYGFIEERLAAIDDVRANGAGAYVMRRFRGVMRRFFYRGRRAWMRRSIIWVGSIGLFSLGSLIALAAGSWLVLGGTLSLGSAYLLYQYMTQLESPIEQISQQMQELQKAAAGLARLSELFAISPALDRTGTEILPAGPLSVEFSSVDFSYGEQSVLSGFDLALAPGTHLGLLGRTGSGKTTITKLLARFYDPTDGAVLLGGHDLRNVDPVSLRRQVAMVTQAVQLFEGSVKDNVTFFDDSVPDETVEAALVEIGLGAWVDTLENGIHTLIGSGGEGLSSGEGQLVAFARAYLHDPGLIILDEPSSRVDPATEAILAVAIERLIADRTAVIIAHRLDTIRSVDEVLILEDGHIVEHGSRTTLAADPSSAFSEMVEASHDGLLNLETAP